MRVWGTLDGGTLSPAWQAGRLFTTFCEVALFVHSRVSLKEPATEIWTLRCGGDSEVCRQLDGEVPAATHAMPQRQLGL